jgi:hypothetical protein
MTRAAALVLVTAVIGACGSDEKDRGAPGNRSATYVMKADAICAQANKKEAAAGAPGPGWIYMPEFDDVRFLKRFNAVGHEALQRLRRLEPPPPQRNRAAEVTAAIERMVQSLDGRIADLEAGTGDASERIKAYLDAYADLTAAAAVLGLSECQGVSL